MKLENQVCSLEQAKKLKELGIVQKSAFYRREYPYNLTSKSNGEVWFDAQMKYPISEHFYSAFSVAELGVMLPDKASTYRMQSKVWYSVKDTFNSVQIGLTQAEAMANTLIYILDYTPKNQIDNIIEIINNSLTAD